MIALRGLVCGGLLLLVLGVGHTTSTDAIQCAELQAKERSTQCALYEYAQIAELAYGPGPANMCTLSNTGAQVGVATDQILVLPDVLEMHRIYIREGVRHPRFDPDRFELYQGEEDNVTRLACVREEDVRLSITWREFLVRSTLYIYFDIKFIAPVRVLVGNVEEAEVINLSRIRANNETGEEQIQAIKGTAFHKIPEVMASANQLLEPSGSCVFEVAAGFVADRVEHIMEEGDGAYILNGERHPVSRFAVVGHSLGGTAAQYIAATVEGSNEFSRRLGRYRNAFNTYSFNAVGLDARSIESDYHPSHYSYFIDGEFASQWAGQLFKQTQIGDTIRYFPPPPPAWPENGVLDWIGRVVRSNTPEPFRRHEISVVQEAICKCINGEGSVQGTPIWHEEGVDACSR